MPLTVEVCKAAAVMDQINFADADYAGKDKSPYTKSSWNK
jgi:hypothetical protein